MFDNRIAVNYREFTLASLEFRLSPNPANFEIWEAGVSHDQATAKGHESLRDLARLLSAPWQLLTLRKSTARVNSLLLYDKLYK